MRMSIWTVVYRKLRYDWGCCWKDFGKKEEDTIELLVDDDAGERGFVRVM